MAVDQLLANPSIWRGQVRRAQRAGIATGIERLDDCLPDRGWPIGALTEVFAERHGIGELSLFAPALARLAQPGSAAGEDGQRSWIAWIAPPFLPYAPALVQSGLNLEKSLFVRAQSSSRDTLWALEQVLRSNVCCAVLAWLGPCSTKILRRLQLLAEAAASLVIVFRPMSALAGSSPAALRLRLAGDERGVSIQILKCHGQHAEIVRMSGWHILGRDELRAGDCRAADARGGVPGRASGDAGWR